jgi:2-desacetyl-2-hydroxyethyl bacteriochlorophyllide A dehydrogenase
MPQVVTFTSPGTVELVEVPPLELFAGHVRVETWYSGISAGTELTAYRGSNPYLTKSWDAERRLFVAGEPTFSYPVQGWGYQEVGCITEVAADVLELSPGDVVFGIWGHRSEAVVPAAMVQQQRLPTSLEPVHGVFARVGAIALNALLAAYPRLGEDVAIFGQGVIGLLTTGLASLAGASISVVERHTERLRIAERLGASHTISPDTDGGAATVLRDITDNAGVDVAIELSGSYLALHEAVRSVTVDGDVVAAGFYQGEATGLRLGEEFHHNRVRIVSSQIGGEARGLGRRWDRDRLVAVFMEQLATGRLDTSPLITHLADASKVADVFEAIDSAPERTLQVVLRFPAAPA